jgi:hypothetical protein
MHEITYITLVETENLPDGTGRKWKYDTVSRELPDHTDFMATKCNKIGRF